VALYHML